MRKLAAVALLLITGIHSHPGWSQSNPSAPVVVRYHYGDDPAWADPAFDDSSWLLANRGQFPSPAYQSDGFFWVRANVTVPAGASGPFAVQLQTADPFPNVQELWVNGRLIGRYGDFPPHANRSSTRGGSSSMFPQAR